MAPDAILTIPGRRNPQLCVPSEDTSMVIQGVSPGPRGGLCLAVVFNIWPVKPFETVTGIKGYTNTI